MMQPSYRPRNPGHDYYSPGIYLITLVVRNRRENHSLLGRLNADAKHPVVALTEIGSILQQQWEKTPLLQKKHGNDVVLHCQCVMPDHWHGVLEVKGQMSWSLGDIIQAVKASLTSSWRKITGYKESPISAQRIKHMSHQNREEYYRTRPLIEQPLFDDNYDDTICLTDPLTGDYCQRHFTAMVQYVGDNVRRAVIRKLRPQFMERRLHVVVDGRDYAAFGNLFLLRWARKVQVFCHRKAADGRTPYHETEAYRQECREWKRKIMEGATVIVTPGISPGERIIKNRCLESGYPLIHLQKEPIGPYWKPEKTRFEACSRGSLLILAPWQPEELGAVGNVPANTDYSVFHNLNRLAEEICLFEGEARIVG